MVYCSLKTNCIMKVTMTFYNMAKNFTHNYNLLIKN